MPQVLHQFFEESARQWPDRTAVEVPQGHGRPERRTVTYAQLSRQADAVAGAVAGIAGRDEIVAILLPRNSERIYSAQLGVMKAGAAYACIEPSFPDTRVTGILTDARALLTDPDGAERARRLGFSGPVLIAENLPECAPAPSAVDPSSLAYVIYTSGTTGRPKGVMIEHAGVVNLVVSDLAEFQLSPNARVSQNSAAVYDSSVEEIWLAFAAGATLVVMDDDAARLGPDLVAWLRRERITVLCPTPTMLRSTGCDRPDRELPDLQFVYLGGEALPPDLSDRWARGRRLVNGYGPTECTVTVTRTDLRPGDDVSIGKAVPGMQAWVLDGALAEVPDGQWGELCLGGVGLARGYRNLPEQTAERFVDHPRFGRIYRSGDLAHRGPCGNLFYHGRADSQVKVRGYRIELEEIEARLAECDGVRAAACTVQHGSLSAFVVPVDGYLPAWCDQLAARLRDTLPEYMVPQRFGILPELPLTTGGKLNRAALPVLRIERRSDDGREPRDDREAQLAQRIREVLDIDGPISIDADFFLELGGNSLRAAQLVTRLREEDPATPVTVRDVYEARTIAALAQRLMPAEFETESEAPAAETARVFPALVTAVQAVWLMVTFGFVMTAGYWIFSEAVPWLMRSVGLFASLLLSPAIFFAGVAAYAPVAVLIAAAAKRCLIGRYCRVRAPVWGGFYVRNWMVQQCVRAVPWWLVESTGFQCMAFRALGARIGKRVHIHRGVDLLHGGWDLLEIGDDVTIGQEAGIGLVELESGQIVVRPVTLGSGCTLETRAGVAGDTELETGAYLTALSWAKPGTRIPAGERWDGIPAARVGLAPEAPDVPPGIPPLLHDCLAVLLRCVRGMLPGAVPAAAAALAVWLLGIDTAEVADWFDTPGRPPAIVFGGLAILMVSSPAVAIVEAWLARLLGREQPGSLSRWSLAYLRIRMKAEMLEAAGGLLAGTTFWPAWLQRAGMKLGRGCEISTILDTIPEMVEMGAGTFLADGIYIGGPRLHRGTVTLEPTKLGSRVFLGNHVVIPAGRSLPDDVLLGVCTVAGEAMEGGRSWFGHPPFELPRREVVACDPRLTLQPTLSRRLIRLFWESLRLILPVPPVVLWLTWLRTVSAAEPRGWMAVAATACTAGMAVELGLCGLVIAVKWTLLGRVRPGQHPFWAGWCGRWDFVYCAWENWARATIGHLEGTLLLSWFLRAMGVQLGRNVVLGPGFSQVVDPDMLIVEDDATVNAMFQAHTFEDRVLKMDYVRVGRGATLGPASVPLYGATIGEFAYVAPHTVVMKDEYLPPRSCYTGHALTGPAKRRKPESPSRSADRVRQSG